MMRRLFPILMLFLLVAPNVHTFGTSTFDVSSFVTPDKRTEIAANMRQARHLMEKEDYVAAKRKLERVLELDKDHAEAKALLVECEQKIEAQRRAELEELNNAVEAGTEQALLGFIERHPEGFFIEQAENYLQDFHLWAAARQKGTKDAYLAYLSTSTVQGYKKEAELAIKTIDAETAWEICKRNMTVNKLEEFIEDYSETPFENEAKYELYLMKAEGYYNNGSHDTALKFYEDANKIHSLTGQYSKHYRELVTEQRYNQVKTSSSVYELVDFLSRTSSDSPYYNPISNRLAIVLANNLTINSTEDDFKEALKYAKDATVRASVKQMIDNVKTRQRDQRSQKRRAERKQRWKGKTSWGWSVLNASFGKDVFEFDSGVRFRIGQSDQRFNFIVGSDIQFFIVSYEDEYYSSFTLLSTDYVFKLAIPASARLNINRNFYLGLGVVLYPNLATTQLPCIAFEPQIGISGILGNLEIHLRHMSNPYGISDKGKVGTMIGYQWTIYF